MKRLLFFVLLVFTLRNYSAKAQQPVYMNSGEIILAMSKLNTLGTVLFIAAHPDDENTRLLAYLANERKFRTVYLSLTRGDGGQNLIGKEQGSELGMIRTQELMAARRVDRAEQYFTRANDFGFSKNPEETFSIWKKEDILADVVWAIRLFRPDVIINRFPTTGEGGHGHHTASAILSLEAFKAAADPTRFPEQLKYVTVWQAKRVFLNSFVPRNQTPPDYTGQLKLDVGGYNPMLGESYGEIAAESRSMHKSQGFGVPRTRGTSLEYFKKQAGDTLVEEIFQNVDTTWNRVKGSTGIETILAEVQSKFDSRNPEKSIPLLFSALSMLKSVEDVYWRNYKENQIKKLIQECSGLYFEVNSKTYYVTPGDTFSVTFSGISRLSADVSIEQITVNDFDTIVSGKLLKNEPFAFDKLLTLPLNSEYTTPFWLKEKHSQDAYVVNDLSKRGEPWNAGYPSVNFVFKINGEKISWTVPISYKWTDPVKGELYRPFETVPPVSLTPTDDILIFNNKNSKNIHLRIKSTASSIDGKIGFDLPKGYSISPSTSEIKISTKDTEIIKDFTLTPTSDTPEQNPVSLKAWVEIKGKKYNQKIVRIEYDHIHPMVLLKDCEIKLTRVDLKSTVKKIGYIEGAGDQVVKCLTEAGFEVTVLKEADILSGSLAGYGAIITGIRAYNILENIDKYYAPLMNYVENGGNLIVQYNTNNFLSTVSTNIGPYPFKIGRDRVTVETAPVTFINPDNKILNSPNKISTTDFDGWVQERGLYFATEIAPEYDKILSWNDPGEKPLDGALIIAQKGKGNFIYTGISFFRQLPAGVPGAYRLITNLINAGK